MTINQAFYIMRKTADRKGTRYMTNKCVLSFGTHPDDIEIGCGGTELRLMSFLKKLLLRKLKSTTNIIKDDL